METVYKFINEKGEHLHTFEGKPLIGTSTVMSVLAKPLTWWASGLVCEKLGWLNSKKFTEEQRSATVAQRFEEIKKLKDKEYLALLDEAYKAHSTKLKDSAEAGTDLHSLLENYVKECIKNEGTPLAHSVGEHEKVSKFVDWSMENVKKFIASEAHCYSDKLWTGGIVDCVCELKDDTIGIIDFKSSKDSYDNQFIQTAGYDLQISENGLFTSEGAEILKLDKISWYAIIPFGREEFGVDFKRNTEQYREGFKSALTLYKLLNLNE